MKPPAEKALATRARAREIAAAFVICTGEWPAERLLAAADEAGGALLLHIREEVAKAERVSVAACTHRRRLTLCENRAGPAGQEKEGFPAYTLHRTVNSDIPRSY